MPSAAPTEGDHHTNIHNNGARRRAKSMGASLPKMIDARKPRRSNAMDIPTPNKKRNDAINENNNPSEEVVQAPEEPGRLQSFVDKTKVTIKNEKKDGKLIKMN